MQPATFALDLYRGDTYRLRVRVWQDTAKTQPVDLAGALAAAEIRDRPGGAIIASLSCQIVVPNTVEVVVTAGVSRPLPASGGVWDLQLTLIGGDVRTVVGGPVTITPDVTASTAGCAPVAAGAPPSHGPIRF